MYKFHMKFLGSYLYMYVTKRVFFKKKSLQVISRCFDYGFRIGITEFSLANNLTAIVSSMNVGDETQTDLR